MVVPVSRGTDSPADGRPVYCARGRNANAAVSRVTDSPARRGDADSAVNAGGHGVLGRPGERTQYR